MKIGIIGLGYVGLPLYMAFKEKGFDIIGYDYNNDKIKFLNQGIDPTNEIGNIRLQQIPNHKFTNDINELNVCTVFIVCVPTPIQDDKTPNLDSIMDATKNIGHILKKGDYVIYESTVYPGLTEELCVPILEHNSLLKYCKEFKVGYSPERINPGDKKHRLEDIIKVVSGCDKESLEFIVSLYGNIIKAGIYKAPSIIVAEAAKVIENTQRDLNIALMNELSMIFHTMGINTQEVLKAAETKWNFMPFKPGLVGGHCIGVDPYYLSYKALELHYQPKMILNSRLINDQMASYVVKHVIQSMIQRDISLNHATIGILGLTFKENVNDIRNTKVIDMYHELVSYGISIQVSDPIANYEEVLKTYNISLTDYHDIKACDVVIIAVAHDAFKSIPIESYQTMFKDSKYKPLIFDLKAILPKDVNKYFDIWQL